MPQITLAQFNALEHGAAKARLLECCNSGAWADGVLALRPFTTLDTLKVACSRVWFGLPVDEKIAVFNSKPQIGSLAELRKKHGAGSVDATEQAGVDGALDEVLQGLIDGNREYEKKFGFRFIIFATGKSAAEMLAALRERLNNTPEAELCIAEEEKHKITERRLFEELLLPE